MKNYAIKTIGKKLTSTAIVTVLGSVFISGYSVDALAACSVSSGSLSSPNAGATVDCSNTFVGSTVSVVDGNDNVSINFATVSQEGNININSDNNSLTISDSTLNDTIPGSRINLTGANSNIIAITGSDLTHGSSAANVISFSGTSDSNSLTLNSDSTVTASIFGSKAIALSESDSNNIIFNNSSKLFATAQSTSGLNIATTSNLNSVIFNGTSGIEATGTSGSSGLINSISTDNDIFLNDSATITTTGSNNSDAVQFSTQASNNSLTLNDNSSLAASGNNSAGFRIIDRSNNNSLIMNNNASISSSANGGNAIVISYLSSFYTGTNSDENTITLNDNSEVSTSNDNADAILLQGADLNTITLNDTSTISTIGNNSSAISLISADNNNININTGASITTTGTSSHGIKLSSNDGNTISLNGGVINSALADGINDGDSYSNRTLTISLSNGAEISGDHAIYSGDKIIGEFSLFSVPSSNTVDITIDGRSSAVSLTGTGGTAIQLGNTDDTLTILGSTNIDGNVEAGDASSGDSLTLTGANVTLVNGDISGFETLTANGISTITGGDINGTGTSDIFNLNSATVTVGSGNKVSGFENINVTGTSIFNGNLDSSGKVITLGNNATFRLNGTFSNSSFTVDNNSVFAGNNTVTGDVNISNGGTIAPGNSIGTINVIGNLTFASGSIFALEVAGPLTDVVNVTGNVDINNGAILNVLPIGSQYSGSSPFLTATGTLNGTWGTVNYNGQATSVLYDTTSATKTATLVLSMVTVNPSLVNALSYTTIQNSQIFTDTVSDEAIDNAFEKGKNFWSKAIYKNSNRETDQTYSGFNSNVGGFAFGYEKQFAENFKAGVSFGNLNNNTNLKLGAGGIDGSSIMAAIYGTYVKPEISNGFDFFSTAALTTGYHDLNNKRTVTNSGIVSSAKSDTNALETSGLLQFGLKKELSEKWSVIPKLAFSYINIDGNGFSETNGGLSNVTINDYNIGMFKNVEGISLVNDKGFTILENTIPNEVLIKPKFDFSLSQEYAATGRSFRGAFSNGSSFTLNADESANRFVNFGLGTDFIFSESTTGNLSYVYSNSDKESRSFARLGVSRKF
jgi:hypothetical protein